MFRENSLINAANTLWSNHFIIQSQRCSFQHHSVYSEFKCVNLLVQRYYLVHVLFHCLNNPIPASGGRGRRGEGWDVKVGKRHDALWEFWLDEISADHSMPPDCHLERDVWKCLQAVAGIPRGWTERLLPLRGINAGNVFKLSTAGIIKVDLSGYWFDLIVFIRGSHLRRRKKKRRRKKLCAHGFMTMRDYDYNWIHSNVNYRHN